jgi:hypothetical protein
MSFSLCLKLARHLKSSVARRLSAFARFQISDARDVARGTGHRQRRSRRE